MVVNKLGRHPRAGEGFRNLDIGLGGKGCRSLEVDRGSRVRERDCRRIEAGTLVVLGSYRIVEKAEDNRDFLNK